MFRLDWRIGARVARTRNKNRLVVGREVSVWEPIHQPIAEGVEPVGRIHLGDTVAGCIVARKLEIVDVDKNRDRKGTRLNSSHGSISYAVFCLKKKKQSQTAASRVGNQLCVCFLRGGKKS